jgi:phosphatidylinositol alpha-mannosyltransferase
MEKISKLRVGLVLDTSLDPTDGVQQYVISVGEWLRGQGHDVHYLVGETKNRSLQNVHSLSKNISVRFNGNRTTIPLPTSRRKLRSFLKDYKFDVLHIQIPHSPFMAQRLILACDDNTAVVGTFHVAPFGKLATLGNRGLGIWLKPSLKRFDQFLSVSSAAASYAKQTFKIDSKVLPNVIDYKLFHDASPKYKDDVLNILFLGRLVERKGCLTLLEAINLLKDVKKLPKFRVTICGKGHLDKGLADIVDFVGFVDEEDKPSYYASADIAVFPSSSGESFGIVLIEAMASGKAVVLAGDNPGYHTVMEPQPDLLFPPKDAKILAQKLELYMRDSEVRRDMAQWGRSYSARFDIELVGHALLDIYQKALRKRRTK